MKRRLPNHPSSIVLFLLWALAACGGAGTEARTIEPFTGDHAEVFEDGVDFVADPDALEGRWREDWSRDLDRRVTWSDGVMILTIGTIRTDSDLDRERTFRLIARVDRVIIGEDDEGFSDEIELIVREGAPGFDTVDGNERQILDQPFIGFVRWHQTDAGEIVPRWHLSPATTPIVSRVEYLAESRRDVRRERGRTTTVIHEAE
ncbi:MAG: hypothetical protein DRJ42_14440 [Deltaproteobacteria bacterium]|nr:MAG: hypothetical protein DRJ42_14440 [Deltaproteobacteria bacterium]